MRAAAAVQALLLLAACSSAPQPREYLCEGGAHFTVSGGDDSVTLVLNGQSHRLPRVHSGSGEKYTDRRLLFWDKGKEAILAGSDHGMVHCRPSP